LVASSGVKFKKPLVLIYPTGLAPLATEAAVIQNTYAKAGIPVKLQALGLNAYVNQLGSGKFDFTNSQYVEIAPTAQNNIGTYVGFGAYFGGWPIAPVAKIDNQFNATDNPAQEHSLTSAYNTFIVDTQAAQLPIVNEPAIDAFSKKLSGLVIDKLDYWHLAQSWLCQ
jgi:hypothetical protein